MPYCCIVRPVPGLSILYIVFLRIVPEYLGLSVVAFNSLYCIPLDYYLPFITSTQTFNSLYCIPTGAAPGMVVAVTFQFFILYSRSCELGLRGRHSSFQFFILYSSRFKIFSLESQYYPFNSLYCIRDEHPVQW